ncbi:serrate RNA effector molecule homolog isoform X3 [Varroa jacobsoni]|uniref:Serrate RNA effector molecule homolog n=3 Tax=Varroa TaxID=62624 RepID=A0A7M7JLH9_VARDE|nr:serrate RNA effector molecule homolog isoform X1 [Varroa destructor]XP_022652264.1 serrate RNA effector molecule homolog isoform X1 [Varroa destructor]XP_022652266.1 serrate RNA effector molecule homolog isoform X1 [Varroa destructor]XP_022652267.1 serrate RNA effector molecule homolog isoform X1 [Varroa destructor]XP_022652268.1 serrate RNA effector molecule homolog isoform X1 [Varroa destructor]XP_022703691.1 serrate RNA effector molecule homolog isoform X3 [Varroa jacobsoni]XP_022703692
MADSDDDFDRRRRDKFARERNDYRDRRDYERDNYSRGRDYGRDYDRRRAYSPLRGGGRDISPPVKRSRYESEPSANTAGVSQPAMLTFKQFLANQDDCIDDQDAVKKYADYKTDFKRQQLEEFFKAHKDEEWFRLKYHPDECHKRKEQMQANIEKRLEVYQKVSDMGLLDKVELDVEKNDDIIRIMDTVAIFLEGGNEDDLKALDEPEPETKPHILEPARDTEKAGNDKDKKRATSTNDSKKEGEEAKAKEKGDDDSGLSENEADDAKKEEGDDEISKDNEDSVEGDATEDKQDGNSGKEPSKADLESGEEDEEKTGSERAQKADITENAGARNADAVCEGGTEAAPKTEQQPGVARPRHLHRTSSIFLRTLSAAITKQEVEAMCRNYPGFLRVALADPQPERKFHRRGWITFERHVNTKEICWKLNNIRLRDTELGAILNRDLSRRVRSVNGIVSAKSVMKSDMKLAAKIIQNLDTQRGLWLQPGAAESKNPLLSNITDYLIEEASAEEEELLGGSAAGGDDVKGENADSLLEKDSELTRVLDRLLWYLRIVHSVDYYSHSEYHNEDEMPNRCGIIHARGSIPTSQVTPKEIEEYIAQFEQKIASYSEPIRPLSLDEAKKLGLKTEQDEVDKFMSENCVELAKEKFLCPLSGKKFKAPEFVHKHILNRHAEKLDEVKKNTMYYNNYVNDPKRPMLPEHPANKPRPPGGNGSHTGAGGPAGDSNGGGVPTNAAPYAHYGAPGAPYAAYPPGRGPAAYGPPHAGYGGPMRGYGPPLDHGPYGGPRYGNKRGGPPFSGGPRGIRDPRPVVGYHDLDTTPDFDMF